ncbi:CaiB/BaiF CoA-transferase family protein, partial [Peribacillus frigoritolerans]|uniref:CaiB/BaiF CoA-transferase family protein n=2 Tax=Bacillaceae TaxID=186817 RepID=UPI003008EEC0
VALLNHMVTGFYATGSYPKRMGTAHATLVPYQGFKASDRDVIIAVANDGLWKKLCIGLEWNDLLENEKYKLNINRVKYREELVTILSERFSQMKSEDIIEMLERVGVPCGPIQTIEEVLTHPQVQAREAMVEVNHPNVPNLKVPAFPVKFSETPTSVRYHPPLLGEHTEEVLLEIGYDQESIKQLKSKNII